MVAFPTAIRDLTAVALLLSCAGCARFTDPAAAPRLLQRAVPSPDSATIEIFAVWTAWPKEDQDLWHQIDELILTPEQQQEWSRNGIRAGQIRGIIPAQLAELLRLSDQASPLDSEPRPVEVSEQPTVRRRVLQLRYGHRGEILATGIRPTFNFLRREQGELRGETLRDAQGLFAMRLEESAAGLVRLVVTPEIRHGPPQQQFVGEQGVFRVQQAQDSLVLEHLRLEVELAPAELLVLTCRPDAAGSLGHQFFSQRTQRGKLRKLVFLRLAEAPVRSPFSGTAK